MDVISVGPLPVLSLVWQPRPAKWALTIVTKATYLLNPGEAALAPEQEALNDTEEHWNDDPSRSLRAPSDLAPAKPLCDVILVGDAFAAGSAPTRSLIARLATSEIDKSIEVSADRVFTPDGSLQEGAPFTRMPLTYERAAGGAGTWNPVGLAPDARDAQGRRRAPNLLPLGTKLTPNARLEPIGFGPIAASWPSRMERVGPHAATFISGAWRTRPLPEGIDLRFFNHAPEDQQQKSLRENERLTLEHLHPEIPRLTTVLPGLRPAVFVERGQATAQRLAMRADTLWIAADRGLAMLIWRGQVLLERPDEAGRVLVGLEQPGRALSFPDLVRIAPRQRSSAELSAVKPLSSTPPPSVPLPSALPAGEDNPMLETITGPLPVPRAPALPFAGARAGEAPARPPSSPALGVPPRPPSQPALALPFHAATPQSSLPAPTPPPAPSSAPALPMRPPPMVRPNLSGPALGEEESPWANRALSGAGTAGAAAGAPARESIGMAAVAAAVALPEVVRVDRAAQSEGALGASNAAAGVQSAPMSVPRRKLDSIQEDLRVESVAEPLQLLWFNPASMGRIRRVPRWKGVLEEMHRRDLAQDMDEADAGKEPWEVEDRQEVFEILARGERTDLRGVEEALRGSVREDGKLVAPLVLVEGDLEFPFDELEALKASVSTATAVMGPGDEGLRGAVGTSKEFLQTPGLSASPGVCRGLVTRIREAFTRERKGVAADYLDVEVEQALVMGRHYQKREVFGGVCLRVLVWVAGEKGPVAGYVPGDLARKLPMGRRFRGRLLAEVHPGQDPYEEARGAALRGVALGRLGGVGRGG